MKALDPLLLFLAQGFGSGRLRPGPGTWGSLVGVVWLLVLLCAKSVPIFCAGVVAGIAASVWLCGEAERILGQHDPGSVVIDEIAAVPLGWLGVWAVKGASTPWTVAPLDAGFWSHWPELLAIFVAFRVFDIWKPWPISRSQNLPGGWGVTADDVLAGLASALPVAAVSWWRHGNP